jgi:ribosomal subunit interface protein
VDIVVKGRNVEVPDHYREHVADKLSKVERYDQKLIRSDVELFHERNPRQSDKCQRVEITVMTRGPVVRAEACAKDFYTDLPDLTPPAKEDSPVSASLAEHDGSQPWRIVREKEHPADPMTVDDALFQMELVGHDFYLFHDKDSGRPSVVYRRRGYDYGILSLESTG